ncbi:MAG: hypothetical protein AB7V32_07005 [Candidatus Berkiella sp.]
MRNLTNQELNSVSGATIANQLPVGTEINGITRTFVDPATALIQTELLCAWETIPTPYTGVADYEFTPYFYNEKYFSSWADSFNSPLNNKHPHGNWKGKSW